MTMIIKELEKQWRLFLPKYSEKEWLKIFPEAKERIIELIKNYKQEKAQLSEEIKNSLLIIRKKVIDEFSQWFWEQWVKYSKVPKLLETEQHLIRFKSALSKSKPQKGSITDEGVFRASQMPIIDVARPHLRHLRRTGDNYIALCPLHQEKTPSFYIYTHTNSFYCYGCNVGGDSINLLIRLHSFSFKEAVQFLLRGFL